jgi:hypothetical protein
LITIVASEAAEVLNHNVSDSPPMGFAVGEHPLELWTFDGTGGLAGIDKYFFD